MRTLCNDLISISISTISDSEELSILSLGLLFHFNCQYTSELHTFCKLYFFTKHLIPWHRSSRTHHDSLVKWLQRKSLTDVVPQNSPLLNLQVKLMILERYILERRESLIPDLTWITIYVISTKQDLQLTVESTDPFRITSRTIVIRNSWDIMINFRKSSAYFCSMYSRSSWISFLFLSISVIMHTYSNLLFIDIKISFAESTFSPSQLDSSDTDIVSSIFMKWSSIRSLTDDFLTDQNLSLT